MKRFSHPARQVPHTADKGQFDNLPGGEIFFHFRKCRLISLGPQMGHLNGPADGSFFLAAEEIAVLPLFSLEQVDLFLRQTESSTELDVMADSIITFRQKRSFNYH